ncbi:HTH-type transcriptional repressor [Geobacillus stearothermophilus]|nr:HTH-type transcriptional repressor [Geobacillus stearothermophilus]WJQ06639.1 TetR/AcrR family transcriptional regulator [Geobacillus stearothermophilus]WJQ10060.1 TetR/AcrR family transcriptional regulator [Geobacillus stearothermophilus]
MKEHIAAVHKQTIAQAAERLFLERGFDGTSISDICAASGYSRRTLYRYFGTKEEILYYIVANGLEQLRDHLTDIVQAEQPFLAKYEHICTAMRAYYEHCPVSARTVHQFQSCLILRMSSCLPPPSSGCKTRLLLPNKAVSR